MQTRQFAPKHDCAIVVPVYKAKHDIIERCAILRAISILAEYPFVILHPKRLDASLILKDFSACPSFESRISFFPLDDAHFRSVATYNRLMLSPMLYNKFLCYNYILIFQLDAWILSGSLRPWLDADYSYVGAPWPPSACLFPWKHDYAVGNGGLSLRKVRDFCKLLNSLQFRYYPVFSPFAVFRRLIQRSSSLEQGSSVRLLLKIALLAIFSSVGFRNNLFYYAYSEGYHEDHIFSLANRVLPSFSIPSAAVAANFAIETSPREVMRRFNVSLPFGCHAWCKYDRSFYLTFFRQYFLDVCDSWR